MQRVAQLGIASRVRVPRAETLEDRAATLRSGLLPQRMAAAGAVLALVPQRAALAVLEVASGQKGRRPVLRERTALVAGAIVLQQQV